MAVTITSEVYLSGGMARIDYTSSLSSPSYYRWRDGIFQDSTTATFWIVPIGAGEITQLDIFDSSSDVPADVFPAQINLQWDGSDLVAMYTVQEYISSEWVTKMSTASKGTGHVHNYRTRVMVDGADCQFRVIPYDSASREGTPLEFSMLMVRRPDKDDFVVTVNETSGAFVLT